MAETKIEGTTIIEDEVIASLAGNAAGEVDGVIALGKSSIRRLLAERIGGAEEKARGVEVVVGGSEVIADLTLSVKYEYNIPKIVDEVRRKVTASLMEMAGLNVKEINVHISHMEFPEKETAFAVKGHQH